MPRALAPPSASAPCKLNWKTILSCSLDPRLFQLGRALGVEVSSRRCTRFLMTQMACTSVITPEVLTRSNQTMVSTIPSHRPEGVRRSARLFSLSVVPLDACFVVVDPALQNRYQSTMD